jgi:hypothetical protein
MPRRLRSVSWPLFLLTAAALLLRLFRLDHFSLRGDEAFDVLFASQGMDAILAQLRMAQPYPPLFHTLFHGWLRIAGESEFVARLPSTLAGTLIVPLAFCVGNRLFDKRAAWLAALLTALNPFLLWHSQDGRMYSLLATTTLASALFLIQAVKRPSAVGLWFAYGLMTLLALLTHYFAAFFLAAQAATSFFLLWKGDGGRGTWVARWLITLGLVVALYLPWVVYAAPLVAAHTSDWVAPVSIWALFQRSMVSYSVGQSVDAFRGGLVAAGFAVAAVAGLMVSRRRGRSNGVWTAALYFLIPLVLSYVGSLCRPMFDEKYLISVVSFYLLLVSAGLVGLWDRSRLLGAVATALVLGGTIWGSWGYYFDVAYAKSPDWRALAGRVRSLSEPGDALVYNYPDPAARYYLADMVPVELLPSSFPVDEDGTAGRLEALAGKHLRVWMLPRRDARWDAEGFVEAWLDAHCDQVGEEAISSFRLKLYRTPIGFTRIMRPMEAQWDQVVRLDGYRLETTPPDLDREPSYAVDSLEGGDILRLTLYWEALQRTEVDYKVFVHLVGPDGEIWDQQDGFPADGARSSTTWEQAETLVDKYAIILPTRAPAGEYSLEVGWYNPETEDRLLLGAPGESSGVDRLVLEVLRVEL